MKPEDLRRPYSWDKRRICLQDRILYLPKLLEDVESWSFPGWQEIFENDRPVHVEYCSGNGEWIASKAGENPQINWVAVEMKFPRVQKIWSKMKNRGLSNILIVCGEGAAATRHFFPSSTVDLVYVNFPDPWPKNRHAKFRMIQTDFISEVWRILIPDGDLVMVTDHLDYSENMRKILLSHSGFHSSFPAPHVKTDWPGYGSSYFDTLWREKGKQIYYHSFQKSILAAFA